MDPGLSAEGYRAKTIDEFKAEIEARQKAAPLIGPTQDYSSDGALGQVNDSICTSLAEVAELIGKVYASGDPDAALGQALTALASLTGTTPRDAAATIVDCVVNLDPGAILAPGEARATVDGRDDLVFTLDPDGDPIENTGGVAADFDAVFVCLVTGPVVVNAETLTVIASGESGWNSITNPEDGETGRNADGPIEIRQRRQSQLALRGGSTVRAIRADLLDHETNPELEGILSVFVLENTRDVPDADGLPRKSFEAVIDDDGGSVDDDAIAQRIFDSKPAGITAHGTESGLAADEYGTLHTVAFSRVEPLEVHIDLELTTDGDFPLDGEDLVAAALVAKGDELDGGDDVIALNIRAAALTVPGVVDVPTFRIDFEDDPTNTANLTVGVRERAVFDTTRVTFL